MEESSAKVASKQPEKLLALVPRSQAEIRVAKKQKHKNGKGQNPHPTAYPTYRLTTKFLQLVNKFIEDQRLLHLARGKGIETFVLDKKLLREIPWWTNLFKKGTTVISLRLNFTSTKISLASSTAYSTVTLLNFALCTNHTPLAAVFDEYRLYKGEVRYRPYSIPNLSPAGATDLRLGAVIDYDDSSALSNYGDAFDTVRYGQIAFGSSSNPKPLVWPIMFDWLPDMTWTTTATTATPVAYWKPFVGSGHGLGAIASGYLEGYMDVQFRQMI